MGHNMASWKTLEDLMLELKKKGVETPANIIADLRSAKSMIKLACLEDSHGNVAQKAEETLGTVEAYLITKAQESLGEEATDRWLKRLEEANFEVEVCEKQSAEGKFVVGVPRDQKWIRVEPSGKLSTEKIQHLATQHNLTISKQNDGRLILYGSQEKIKEFIKKTSNETAKK
jgi:hypothetical protein